jgi:hypothetical protein
MKSSQSPLGTRTTTKQRKEGAPNFILCPLTHSPSIHSSDNIDQALKTEKAAKAAARRKQRKVLVLGQSTHIDPRSAVYTFLQAKGMYNIGSQFISNDIDQYMGNSESGKSTLVKQFRLLQSSEAFAIERESWKRYAQSTQAAAHRTL